MGRPAGIRALVVGAVSRDRDLARPGARDRPGGVVLHAGRTWARLGARTGVLTRLHPADAPLLLASLEALGVAVTALPSAATTVCANDYRAAVDRHELLATSDPIRAADVPSTWRDAEVVQLGPLHPRDLDADLPRVLRGRLAIDLQGLLRAPPGESAPERVVLDGWLQAADVVQVSADDVPRLAGGADPVALCRTHHVAELLLTLGARGVDVVTPSGCRRVAAQPVQEGDPTGAGDVFLAAYLFARATAAGPLEAAARACRMAAAHVTAGSREG